MTKLQEELVVLYVQITDHLSDNMVMDISLLTDKGIGSEIRKFKRILRILTE